MSGREKQTQSIWIVSGEKSQNMMHADTSALIVGTGKSPFLHRFWQKDRPHFSQRKFHD